MSGDTIPSDSQIQHLWDVYQLPKKKRVHVTLVATVADFLAKKISPTISPILLNFPLIHAAALLHDIDNGVAVRVGEIHPDAAVRILQEEGLFSIADLVKTHSLYAVLDPNISPKKWEEKVLYLADKMVKYEIITVDKRFELWKSESLPIEAIEKLALCYPQVKSLESEIFNLIDMVPDEVSRLLS